MLDRINMTCPKCGSTEVHLISFDDQVPTEEIAIPALETVRLVSECKGCGFFKVGSVQIGDLVNLLRALNFYDESTSRALKRGSALRDRVMAACAPWLSSDFVGPTTRRAIREDLLRALPLIFPDVYAWFNRKPCPSTSRSAVALYTGRHYSRSAYYRYMEKISLYREVWAVAIAIIRIDENNILVPTVDITNAIRAAYCQPLAS